MKNINSKQFTSQYPGVDVGGDSGSAGIDVIDDTHPLLVKNG